MPSRSDHSMETQCVDRCQLAVLHIRTVTPPSPVNIRKHFPSSPSCFHHLPPTRVCSRSLVLLHILAAQLLAVSTTIAANGTVPHTAVRHSVVSQARALVPLPRLLPLPRIAHSVCERFPLRTSNQPFLACPLTCLFSPRSCC